MDATEERTLQLPPDTVALLAAMAGTSPLYVPMRKAAKMAGVSEEQMRTWAACKYDPLPCIKSGERGGRLLVSVADLPEYLRRRQAV